MEQLKQIPSGKKWYGRPDVYWLNIRDSLGEDCNWTSDYICGFSMQTVDLWILGRAVGLRIVIPNQQLQQYLGICWKGTLSGSSHWVVWSVHWTRNSGCGDSNLFLLAFQVMSNLRTTALDVNSLVTYFNIDQLPQTEHSLVLEKEGAKERETNK